MLDPSDEGMALITDAGRLVWGKQKDATSYIFVADESMTVIASLVTYPQVYITTLDKVHLMSGDSMVVTIMARRTW